MTGDRRLLPNALALWSPEKINDFLSDYHAGVTQQKMGERFGVKDSRISEYVSAFLKAGFIEKRRPVPQPKRGQQTGRAGWTYIKRKKQEPVRPDVSIETLWGSYNVRLAEVKRRLADKLEVLGAPGAELYRLAGDSRIYTPAALMEYDAMSRRNVTVIQGGKA